MDRDGKVDFSRVYRPMWDVWKEALCGAVPRAMIGRRPQCTPSDALLARAHTHPHPLDARVWGRRTVLGGQAVVLRGVVQTWSPRCRGTGLRSALGPTYSRVKSSGRVFLPGGARKCCRVAAMDGGGLLLRWVGRGPDAAAGPRPRAFNGVYMRQEAMHDARTPGVACARTCPHLASSPMMIWQSAHTGSAITLCTLDGFGR
jgi:hypothetical protein